MAPCVVMIPAGAPCSGGSRRGPGLQHLLGLQFFQGIFQEQPRPWQGS